jgi:hypothetical protein
VDDVDRDAELAPARVPIVKVEQHCGDSPPGSPRG